MENSIDHFEVLCPHCGAEQRRNKYLMEVIFSSIEELLPVGECVSECIECKTDFTTKYETKIEIATSKHGL